MNGALLFGLVLLIIIGIFIISVKLTNAIQKCRGIDMQEAWEEFQDTDDWDRAENVIQEAGYFLDFLENNYKFVRK